MAFETCTFRLKLVPESFCALLSDCSFPAMKSAHRSTAVALALAVCCWLQEQQHQPVKRKTRACSSSQPVKRKTTRAVSVHSAQEMKINGKQGFEVLLQ